MHLQPLIKRVTGLAIVILTVSAAEAQILSIPQSVPTAVAEETFGVDSTSALSLQQRGGVETQWLAQTQQPKTALVIGNSAYPEGALANPDNDATDIARALESLGFAVTLRLDLDLRGMEDAINAFSQQLSQGGVGLFYYAGHGVQVEGENYLIPINAMLAHENDVRYETLPLGKVLNAMEDSESQVNIVIIDACRSNPFSRQWSSSSRGIAAERGLAFTVPPEGTIISFATDPGNASSDGAGRNSPYTASLLQHITTEGADVATMFRQVRADVIAATDGMQHPWYQESLTGYFSFNPAAESVPPPPPTQPAVSPSPTQAPTPPDNPSPTPASPIPEPTTSVNRPPTPASPSLEPTPVPQPDSTSGEPTLISAATGINYQALRDALAAGDFEEADTVTRSLMLQAAGRQSVDNLQPGELSDFSCEDLRIIDRLWVDYSDGKFGFSVQRRIYQSLGGTGESSAEVWNNFGSRVGWRVNNRWVLYDDVRFNASAPQGHLPFFGRFGHWKDREMVMQWIFSLSCGDG